MGEDLLEKAVVHFETGFFQVMGAVGIGCVFLFAAVLLGCGKSKDSKGKE